MVSPRQVLVFAAPFFLFAGGCQGAPTDPAPTASASQAKSASGPPKPPPESSAPLPPRFTGELTVALVQSAKGSLPEPKPLREALGDLEAKLGPPTRTRRGATMGPDRTWYEWAAANATTCATYSAVEQPNLLAGWPSKLVDDRAKSIAIPAHVITDPSAKDAPSVDAEWRAVAECFDVMGKKPPLPPDDPKGKGPGAPVTYTSLMQGLYLAPSLWIGKTVTLRGTLRSTSQTVLSIEATGEPEKGTTIACKLSAGESGPAKEAEPITVTGVVADPREPVDVTVTELVDCKVKVGDP